MQLTLSDFLTYQTVHDEEKGGFLLHPDGARHAMTLARRRVADETASPCVFLLRTNDQHAVCGLGDLRPAQCRTFPTYLADGFVAVVHKPAGCVRTWSYGDIDVEEERRELLHLQAEDTAHNALVEEWNRRVRSDGRERPFEEFCAFVINHSPEQEGSI
jgi:Fe-S-cluster containining protein